jgi:hemoglobin
MDSLYDAIGGLPALEAAVQRFCERVRTDMEVAEFFVWTDLHQQKSRLIALLSQAVGGPTRHIRATIAPAHAYLRIEERHFDVVADHLAGTLEELGIADVLVAAVMDRIWPLAPQIVDPCFARAAAA